MAEEVDRKVEGSMRYWCLFAMERKRVGDSMVVEEGRAVAVVVVVVGLMLEGEGMRRRRRPSAAAGHSMVAAGASALVRAGTGRSA